MRVEGAGEERRRVEYMRTSKVYHRAVWRMRKRMRGMPSDGAKTREEMMPAKKHSVRGSTSVEALLCAYQSQSSFFLEMSSSNSHDHVLAHSNPADPAPEKGVEGHAPYGIASNLSSHGMPHAQIFPDRLANHVILAKILAKRRQSISLGENVTLASFPLLLRRALEIRFAVQARLASHTGSNGHPVDGEVHFGVSATEEDLLYSRAEVGIGVDGEGKVVYQANGPLAWWSRSSEEFDRVGEGGSSGEDVRVNDPEDVVRSRAVGTEHVANFRVHDRVDVAC